ncbi:hypothetical protein [Streptomyces acidiscabies]|uniref:Uncharacterized protein n=1 Tax=Streptomyces acidiscabies TaxID=42234 RepID=A0AAP6B8H5_9ACTN|nr:hypothetical protein [Streptomyces acidiscabies]MDX2960134.1 hypothetical protein [Streptomyces acidiscabies]MDX3019485.1 hypothetical protein [Streptomyces acidiscabies]MDX3793116.1 hypothetical protein [Streptomyces acidiscabies]GAV39516.1 hypothetical protein Saa2_02402 [Streptomyces acidiscabies]
MAETRPAASPRTENRTKTRTENRTEDPAPPQWHRILTLLSAASLFIGTRDVWAQAASHHPPLAAAISVCYAAILLSGVAALTTRTARLLARIDLTVLVTAVILVTAAWLVSHQGGDESALTTKAAQELIRGHAIYGQPWPQLFKPNIALTQTIYGGYDYTYGYPPLAPLLTAPFLWLHHGGTPATAMATTALLVSTVTVWRLLPRPWRPAVTMLCLGFGFLPMYGRQGYPAILALALLMPTVIGWPRAGRGGRLGSSGITRAILLGAACAAQQLPWFVTPFLLAGIYAVRRGELGPREAARIVLRLLGITAATWLAINAYFAVHEPGTWLEGIALPLTQGAVVHGQGLVGISLYLTDGSDRLDWYSHASMLLAAGLLALYVLFVRRLGPAATVLPWLAFFVATRSQDGYYLMMTPLWLLSALTAPLSEFADAWQPRPRFLSPRPAAVLALVPALLSTALAVTGSPPLRMSVASVRLASPRALSRLTVDVRNVEGTALVPHFTVSTGQGMPPYWTVVSGPARLAGHSSARYELRPPRGTFTLPARSSRPRIRLRVFTGDPQTLSSQDIQAALPLPRRR